MYKSFPYLFVIFFLINLEVCAQQKDIKFKQITSSDGVSLNNLAGITSILQDSRGFMWFGTRSGGVSKFDGHTFTSYTHNPKDKLTISNNNVQDLLEDKEGNIWIATRVCISMTKD